MENGLITLFFGGLVGIPGLALKYPDRFHIIAKWISYPAIVVTMLILAWMVLLPEIFNVFTVYIESSKMSAALEKKEALMPPFWVFAEAAFFWIYPILITGLANAMRPQ
ncbi:MULTISPECIES: hypothetical protein [Pseudomonas]|uniref:hypothetical protein n=1 Tax=Pseudomonas TaxID=286 RepID=UPI00257C8231|nr:MULTISPECIES: hypothetical protein [Pseudomonas]